MALDDKLRTVLLETLKMVSERCEKNFPEVPEGAVVSGHFLLLHQANRIRIERAFKKFGNKYYLFKSIPEVGTSETRLINYHPYYELEAIYGTKD